MRVRGLGTAAVSTALAVLSGCYWSQPGYDAGGSGFNEDENRITTANVSTLGEIWAATLEDGSAQAIVESSAGSFHVTDASGVYAIEPNTGTRLWRTPVAGLDGTSTHPVGGSGEISVPTIDAAATPEGQLVRLDADSGAVIESLPSTGRTTQGHEVLRTARRGDWVVTTFQSSWVDFVCLCWVGDAGFRVTNLADPGRSWGWSYGPTTLTALSNPVIVGGRFYATKAIYAFDPTSPSPTPVSADIAGWDLADPCTSPCTPDFLAEHPGEPITSEIAAAPDGTAIVAGIGDTLRAVDLATGATAWTTDARSSRAAPTWTPDGVFRLVTDPDDTLAAYPADCAGTCAPAWTTPLPGEPVGQASAAGDLLFVGTDDGTLAAYPTTCTDGCAPVWSVDLGSAISAPPIVTQARVIVGTADGRVVAFGLPG